jgi:hypothetical protein
VATKTQKAELLFTAGWRPGSIEALLAGEGQVDALAFHEEGVELLGGRGA